MAPPSRARVYGLLGLVAASTPLALLVESALRRLMMPEGFEAVRAWLSPTLTPWAWAMVPATLVTTGLGWWLFGVLKRRELRLRRPEASSAEAQAEAQAKAQAKAEFEALMLASSAPQVPAVAATILYMAGAQGLPVAITMGAATLGVLSLGAAKR